MPFLRTSTLHGTLVYASNVLAAFAVHTSGILIPMNAPMSVELFRWPKSTTLITNKVCRSTCLRHVSDQDERRQMMSSSPK
jgi:hypothetical protein